MLGFRLGGLDESIRGVDPGRFTVGADDRRQLLGRVAEPATQVKDAVTRIRRVGAKRLVAVRGKAGEDDVAEG